MDRAKVALVLLAAIPAVSAACSNDDERLSSVEFTDRVKAACVTATEAGDEALPFDPPPEMRLTSERIDAFAASLEGFSGDVRALAAPRELEEESETFASAVDAYASEFREVADEGGTEDELEAALDRLFSRFGEIDRHVTPLGLSSILGCGGEIESHVPPEAQRQGSQ